MKEKVLTVVWSLSLFLISVSAVVTGGANILGISLPDAVLRIFGGVQLLSVGMLGYSTVKKFFGKQEKE